MKRTQKGAGVSGQAPVHGEQCFAERYGLEFYKKKARSSHKNMEHHDFCSQPRKSLRIYVFRVQSLSSKRSFGYSDDCSATSRQGLPFLEQLISLNLQWMLEAVCGYFFGAGAVTVLVKNQDLAVILWVQNMRRGKPSELGKGP